MTKDKLAIAHVAQFGVVGPESHARWFSLDHEATVSNSERPILAPHAPLRVSLMFAPFSDAANFHSLEDQRGIGLKANIFPDSIAKRFGTEFEHRPSPRRGPNP